MVRHARVCGLLLAGTVCSAVAASAGPASPENVPATHVYLSDMVARALVARAIEGAARRLDQPGTSACSHRLHRRHRSAAARRARCDGTAGGGLPRRTCLVCRRRCNGPVPHRCPHRGIHRRRQQSYSYLCHTLCRPDPSVGDRRTADHSRTSAHAGTWRESALEQGDHAERDEPLRRRLISGRDARALAAGDGGVPRGPGPRGRSARGRARPKCGRDSALRADVEALLAGHAEASRAISLDALPQLSVGTLFGPYRIEALVGAGGMGQVYAATDTRLRRTVAIKGLMPDLSADPACGARFEREAQLLASLNHPNIAAIYGLEAADGVQALVLEFVEGPTLAEHIALVGRVPLTDALRFARQIARVRLKRRTSAASCIAIRSHRTSSSRRRAW